MYIKLRITEQRLYSLVHDFCLTLAFVEGRHRDIIKVLVEVPCEQV